MSDTDSSHAGGGPRNDYRSADPDLRLELVSNPVYLAGARELVSTVALRLGFDDLACAQIALAVDEALCNVIRHGYKSELGRPIWLSIWPLAGENGSAGGIRIVIEDEAPHVDPERIKGRELDDVKPGGLGVHIIREVMDDVVFEHRQPTGMRLKLEKRIAPGAKNAPERGPARGGDR